MTVHYYISEKALLLVAQVLNWFTKEHLIAWFFGDTKRSRRIEVLLPRLVRKGKLIARKFGKRNVYIVPRMARNRDPQIKHGLGVTEGLVRFFISDRSGEIIPARKFHGLGVRPEWGMMLGDKIFLFEFCTKDNSSRLGVLKTKINAYSKMNRIVIFIMEIPRESVVETIKKLKPEGSFMFTDYETFNTVPLGEQFTAPIYIWGDDLNVYPLRPKPTHQNPIWKITAGQSDRELR